MKSFSDKFKELFGRDPSAEELAKAMKLTAKLEKDKVRKALHGLNSASQFFSVI